MNRVKKIKISDFRAFEGTLNLDFTLESGDIANLVVIHAPNGVGKTSIFDAVEWGLTGRIHRLEETIETECHGNILKNRHIKDGEEAYVEIESESNIKVERKTNKRSKYTDYNIGTILNGGKYANYNDWSSMILPHSRIDGFVAASTPEDKFEEWGKLWDSNEESKDTFRFISGLKKYTDNKLENIKTDIEKLHTIVESIKIEESIYNKINSAIDEVNNFECNSLGKILDCLDYEGLNTLQIDILGNAEKLNTEINTLEEKNKKTLGLKGKFDNYQKHIKTVNEYKVKLEMLNSKITNIKKYLENEKKFNSNNKKYVKVINEIDELNIILRAGEQWINAKLNHNKSVMEFESAEKQIALIKKDIIIHEDKLASSQKEKKNLDKKILNLKNIKVSFIDKLEDLYNKESNGKNSKENLITEEKEYSHLEEQYLKLKEKRNSLEKLILNENTLLSDNVMKNTEENGFDTNELVKIFRTAEVISGKKKDLAELESHQNIIDNSLSIHEKLVMDAVNWIENNNSTICPVCRASYDDYEILLEKVRTDFNKEILKDDKNAEIYNYKTEIEKMNQVLVRKREKWNININNIIANLAFEMSSLSLKLDENRKKIDNIKQSLGKNNEEIYELKEYYYRNGLTDESIISPEIINEWYTLENNCLEQERKKITVDLEYLSKSVEAFNNSIEVLINKSTSLKKNIEEFCEKIENIKIDGLYKKYDIDYSIKEVHDTIEIKKEALKDIEMLKKELTETLKTAIKYTDSDLELKNKEKEELEKDFTVSLEYVNVYKLLYSEITNNDKVELEEIETKRSAWENLKTEKKKFGSKLEYLKELVNTVQIDRTLIDKKSELERNIEEKARLDKVQLKIDELFSIIKKRFIESVSNTFNNVLSNDIFSKIEAHPIMNRIEFDIDLSNKGQPQLKILVSDKDNSDQYLPEWFFSSAQLNALALSMFLSKAISNNDAPLSTIFIDDPIGHFDDINVISFVDVIRSINETAKFQVVLSTHDESIFKLLRIKLSSEFYKSKFIELSDLIENSKQEAVIG
jgi:DNA repair exonuclease SbcCD ATPase subunit